MDSSKSSIVKALKVSCELLRERHRLALYAMVAATVTINKALFNADKTNGYIPETTIEHYENALDNERTARETYSKAYDAWNVALCDMVGVKVA